MREKFERPLAYIQTLNEYKAIFRVNANKYTKSDNFTMAWVLKHLVNLLSTELEAVYDDLYNQGLTKEQVNLWLTVDTRYRR